jgi:hypothetical protein
MENVNGITKMVSAAGTAKVMSSHAISATFESMMMPTTTRTRWEA